MHEWGAIPVPDADSAPEGDFFNTKDTKVVHRKEHEAIAILTWRCVRDRLSGARGAMLS